MPSLRRIARGLRLSALPPLVDRAPSGVVLAVGAVLAVLGILIVARPLTSLFVLALYIGLSAIGSGVIEVIAGARREWWNRAISIAWIVGGVAILVWLGRSIEALPGVLAVLLILGGVASIGDAITRGAPSQRVLALAWGAAQLVFGVLALTWPDVTLLVVALVFGLRTLFFGASLIVRAVRALRAEAKRRAGGEPVGEPDAAPRPSRAARAWAAAGRSALAVALVVAAGGAWWVNDWLDEGAPVVDAFYDAPEDVPTEHGALVRDDEFAGTIPPDATVRRILYTTIDSRGVPAVASALVIVPAKVLFAPRDVVLWNHGTTGVARGCAPSLREASATKWAIPALDDAIDRGWIVVAPDYTGQGAEGTFPYLIGNGEAQSALDAVLAADDLDGVWLSGRVAVWGHSQGGHAALWSTHIAEEYASALDVVGTAVLAPAADPLALARALTGEEATPLLSVLISWVLVPYADTYPDVTLSEYVAPGARSIVREMTARCPTEPGVMVSVLAAVGVSEDRPLYIGELTAGSLGRRLAQNAATGPWTEPMLVAWGSADEVIPPELQQDFVDGVCDDGGQVRWAVYEGEDHLGVLLPDSRFLPTLMAWTDDRFRGADSPVDDCAR